MLKIRQIVPLGVIGIALGAASKPAENAIPRFFLNNSFKDGPVCGIALLSCLSGSGLILGVVDNGAAPIA